MQIVYLGDNLHEMSKPIFWEKNLKSISNYHLLKILPRMLSINYVDHNLTLYSVEPQNYIKNVFGPHRDLYLIRNIAVNHK